MKRVLALAAALVLAGPVLAQGSDSRGPAAQPARADAAPAAMDSSVALQAVPLAEAADGATKEAKKQYTCPMHPDVVSDKPGKCPKCGMNLVEKKANKAEKDAPKAHDHGDMDMK